MGSKTPGGDKEPRRRRIVLPTSRRSACWTLKTCGATVAVHSPINVTIVRHVRSRRGFYSATTRPTTAKAGRFRTTRCSGSRPTSGSNRAIRSATRWSVNKTSSTPACSISARRWQADAGGLLLGRPVARAWARTDELHWLGHGVRRLPPSEGVRVP